jgi:hypothetical protein
VSKLIPGYLKGYAEFHSLSLGEAAAEIEAEGLIHDKHNMQTSIDGREGWYVCICGVEIEGELGCMDHRSLMKGHVASYVNTPDGRIIRSTEKVTFWTVPHRNAVNPK